MIRRFLTSILFTLLTSVALLTSSCKDSTTGPGTGDTTKTTALDTFLVLTTPSASVITVNRGEQVPFDFTVQRSGKLVDSATISFADPILQSGVTLGPSVNGDISFTETIPGNLASGTYRLVFRARYFARDLKPKADFILSDSLVRTIIVTGRLSDSMQLAAHAKGPDGITVSWTRLFGDKGIDTLIATANGVATAVPSSASEADVTGLQTGVIYALSVHTSTAVSETIHWATAERYGPIRLYETADNTPGHYSGLVFQGGQVVSVSPTNPNRQSVDIVLATDTHPASGLSLVAASVDSLSGILAGKPTLFSDFPVFSRGLDYTSYRKDFSQKFDSAFNVMEIPKGQSEPMVFQLRSADHHYAQMEIIPQADGTLYGTDADGKYFIDVLLSYQPVADVPYASRPRPTHTEARRSRH